MSVPDGTNGPTLQPAVGRASAQRVVPKFEDIVWAKYQGCPYWPAKVLMRENELGQGFDDGIEPADRRSDEHLCHFFGTYDVAWIPENRVVHFNDAPPDLTKKSRTKPFLRAIAEARQWRIDKVDPEGFNGCSNFQTDLSDDGEDEGPGYGYGADHPVSVATQAAALVAVSFPRFSPQWLAAQKRKWKLQVLAGKRRKLSEPSPADGFRSPQHSEESTRGMALPLATAPKAGSNTPHNSKTHPPPPATGKPKPARPPPPPTTGKPKLAPPPPPPATGTPKPAKAPPPLAATVKAKASAIQGKKPTDGSLGGAKRMRKLPISVSVFTLKDGTSNVYKSGAEAERALQIPRGTVPNVLAGKSEATYKGMYTFRKVERPGSAQPAGTKAQGAAAHTPGAAAATDKTAAAGVAPGSATPQQHGVPDNAGGVQGLAHNNAGAGDTPPIKKASPAQGATGTPGEKLAAKQNERARLVHGWVKQRLASGASIVGKQEDRDDFTARTGVGVSSFNKWMRKAGLQYNQSAGCWGKPKSTLGGAHTSKPDPSLPSTPGLAPGTVAALGTKATPSTAQSMARAPEPGGPANGQTQGGSHGSDLAVQDRLDAIEYWKRKGLDLSGVPGVIVEQKPPGAPGQASKKPGLYPTTLLGATSKHPRERYVEQEKKDCKYVADDCNNLACPNGNHADGEVNRIRMRRYKAMVAVNGRHPTPEVNPAAGFFEFSRAKRSTWTKGCSDTFRTKGGLQEHLKKCEFGSAPASAKKRASSKAKAAAGRNDPAAASGARGGGAAVAANPVGFLPSADHGSRPSPGEEHGAFGAQDAVPPRLALPAAATARTSLPQGELQQADLSPAKTAMLLD